MLLIPAKNGTPEIIRVVGSIPTVGTNFILCQTKKLEIMKTITAKEKDVLQVILNNEFNDEHLYDYPVWISVVQDYAVTKGRAFAGVVSSLVQKELVTVNSDDSNDGTISVNKSAKRLLNGVSKLERTPSLEIKKEKTKPKKKPAGKPKKATPYGTSVEIMCKKPDMSYTDLLKALKKKGFTDSYESAARTAHSVVRKIVTTLVANGWHK